jgi:hypothetical protein
MESANSSVKRRPLHAEDRGNVLATLSSVDLLPGVVDSDMGVSLRLRPNFTPGRCVSFTLASQYFMGSILQETYVTRQTLCFTDLSQLMQNYPL